MEDKAMGFVHTFLLVLACIALYNSVVRSFVPTPIQSAIGL